MRQSPRSRRARSARAAVALSLAVVPSATSITARAGTPFDWVPVGGNYNGSFTNAAHWDPAGGPPGEFDASDEAHFIADQQYTITLSQPGIRNINRFDVHAGLLTLDLTNNAFLFINSGGFPQGAGFQVAEDVEDAETIETANLLITSSDHTGSAFATGVGVGRGTGNGTLRIDGLGQFLQFNASFYTAVGYTDEFQVAGTGTLNVVNGAHYRTPQGYVDGGVNVLHGSYLGGKDNPGDANEPDSLLRIGITGNGTFTVDSRTDPQNTFGAEASLTADHVIVGQGVEDRDNTGVSGKLHLFGDNTNYIGGTLVVSQYAPGEVTFWAHSKGTLGSVDVGAAFRDARTLETEALFAVQDDAEVHVTGDVRIGVQDQATLTVGGFIPDPTQEGVFVGGRGQLWSDNAVVGVHAPGLANVSSGYSFSINGGPSEAAPATWNVAKTLTVAQFPDAAYADHPDGPGVSELHIFEGGVVNALDVVVADQPDLDDEGFPVRFPEGTIRVEGAFFDTSTGHVSTLAVGHDLVVGNKGTGHLLVENSARVTVAGTTYVGRAQGGSGDILIAGISTNPASDKRAMLVTPVLYAGGEPANSGGRGEIHVGVNGRLYVANEVLLRAGSQLVLERDLAPGVTDHGAIVIGTTPGGTPDVPANSFVVGYTSAGRLSVQGFATVHTAFDMLLGDQWQGEVFVSEGIIAGSGPFAQILQTRLQVDGTLTLGKGAAGFLLVGAGAGAQAGNVVVGSGPNVGGQLIVTGVGNTGIIPIYSVLNVAGDIKVGMGGLGSGGTFTLSAGADAFTNNLVVAATPGTQSTVTVVGDTVGSGDTLLSVNNATTVNNAGTIVLQDAGRMVTKSLAVNAGGAVRVRSGASLFVTQSLAPIAGEIDVSGGVLAMDKGTGLTAANISALLAAGYHNGKFDVGGITSTTARGDENHATAVGFLEEPTLFTLRTTWYGDTNLDGIVNRADLNRILAAGTRWQDGDFNHDRKVSSDDYALFALGFAMQSGTFPASAAVPEPAVAGVFALSAMFARRRRVRRR